MEKSGVGGSDSGVELTSSSKVGVIVVKFWITWVSVGSDGVKLAVGESTLGVTVAAPGKPIDGEHAFRDSKTINAITPRINNSLFLELTVDPSSMVKSGIC